MSKDLQKAHRYVQFVDNSFGGKLKVYGESATLSFWDRKWSRSQRDADYQREEHGHLAFPLRKAFLGRIEPGARVLEAGCGLGRFTVAMHSRGYDITGVDYAPAIIEMLRARFPEVDFRFGDVTNLEELESESIDAIYSLGVCEHFEDGPEPVFQEAFRLLKPGGLLVNSSPCFNPVRRHKARHGHYCSEAPVGAPFYQWVYSREEMSAILIRSGFEVETTINKACVTTLNEVLPDRGPVPGGKIGTMVGAALDRSPLSKYLGHSGLWVARKSRS